MGADTKKEQEKDELDFQTRVVLVMFEEMKQARLSMEASCIAFVALAKSIGVNIQF